MAEYHVRCGIAGIYAGILSNTGGWKSKCEVTDEAVGATAQYLLESKKTVSFSKGGKRYRMEVNEVSE